MLSRLLECKPRLTSHLQALASLSGKWGGPCAPPTLGRLHAMLRSALQAQGPLSLTPRLARFTLGPPPVTPRLARFTRGPPSSDPEVSSIHTRAPSCDPEVGSVHTGAPSSDSEVGSVHTGAPSSDPGDGLLHTKLEILPQECCPACDLSIASNPQETGDVNPAVHVEAYVTSSGWQGLLVPQAMGRVTSPSFSTLDAP